MIFATYPFNAPLHSATKRLFYIFGPLCLFLAAQALQAQPCTASISGELVICPGGSRVLTASAATNYLWSNGAMTNTITVTTAGTYTVTTTNAVGCTATASATTRILSAGTISAPVPQGFQGYPVCFGSTLQLSSTVPGGTWSTFSSFPAVSVNPVTGLATGIAASFGTDTSSVGYRVSATGCTASAFTMLESRGLNPGTISGGNTNLCYNSFGVQTTQLSTNASGGVWASSNPAITVNSSGLVSTTGPGTTTISYTVTFEGCANSATTQVTWNARPNTLVTAPPFVCPGETFAISVPNAGLGTTYNWAGTGITNVNSNATTITLPPSIPAGTQSYTVTITPANGCGAIGFGNVSVGTVPNATIAATPNPVCIGLMLNLSVPAAASTTYAWSGNGLNSTTGSMVTATPTILGTQTYTVTATGNAFLGGCSNTSSANVEVTFCCPTITFTMPNVTQPTCTTAGTIVVNAFSTGPLQYSVDNGANWQTSSTFSGLAPGNYTIKARLASAPTCEASYGSNPVVLNSPFTTSTTTDTWTGCVSTNWSTPGNWADGSVPTASNHAIIPDVANDPVIMAGTAAVAQSTEVQGGAVLTLASTGSLTLNGTLSNFGTVTNSGTISIGNTIFAGQDNIFNFGNFTNTSTGIISVDRASNGIWHVVGSFQNSGIINIGSVATTGTGILSYAPFTNHAGAQINIDRTDSGIVSTSAFTNAGLIRMGENGPLSGSGLVNTGGSAGIFNNDAGAEISIKQTAVNGLLNDQNAVFNNNSCAILTIFDNLNNAGTLTNTGLWTVNTAQAHTNSGLTNNGIIAYPVGNPIPNVTNNEIVIAPTTANGCDVISPAFGLGSPVNFTILGVFTDAAATNSAGTFTVANNTFTPTAILPEGVRTYYVQIMDGGCTRIVPWQLTTQNCCAVPQALCQTATIPLVGNSATLTVAAVNNGSTAACGLQSISVAPNAFNCSHVGTPQTVTLTVTDVNNASSTCQTTVTVADQTAPTITCPANTTVAAGANCSATLASYVASATANDNCTASPNKTQSPAAGTTITGAQVVTLTATDAASNTATCSFTVTVADQTAPTITCPANATVNANANCQSTIGTYGAATVSDNCNPSPSVTQNPAASTLLTGHNSTQTVTLTANDGNGNTATCALTVTLKDVTAPTITCPANATVNANANCQSTIGTYGAATVSDNCNPSPSVVQSPAASTLLTGHNSAQTVTLTANDGNGNTATCSLVVTLKDVTAPTITCPANATVNANANCQSTIGTYGAATVSDNCNPSPAVVQSPVASTLLTGHNSTQTVVLTANDGNGNTATCALTVTLKDVTAPTITCPANATVNANANCQSAIGTYGAATVSDNCNPSPTVVQSPAASTLLTGHNSTQTVTLTANDGNGNTATCSLTVTLKDVTAPTITCPANATVNANASCQSTIGTYAAATVSDNCNPSPTVVQSPAASTLLTGHNSAQTVVLTANDGNGNTATCSLTVTLKDVTAPTITCPANATVNANASCQSTIGTYGAATVSDNCNPSPSVVQSPVASTLLTGHNSTQTVTLTANDGNGNTATCALTVTLKDVTAPTITCLANATVNANANCQSTIGTYGAATVSDNCNPSPTVVQSPAASTLLTGQNSVQTVVLTANDGNGNTATCSLTVTLKDVTAPTITCPANATVNANASCQSTIGTYGAATVSDNCNPSPSVVQSPAASTLLTGHNSTQTVTLTVNDGNGNTATCSLTVTLKDVTAPTITCPANATVNANASCQSAIGTYGAATVSDNCNPSPSVTQNPVASTLLTGQNSVQTVVLTANDGNGNTATCALTVTLRDIAPPTLICKNFLVSLNTLGTATLNAVNVFQSGTDNCGTVSPISVTPNAFNCSNIGATTVTLVASDGNGNTATCTALVKIEDIIAPTMICQNVTVALNASGQATVTPAQVNNGSTDNCGIATLSLSRTTFNCADLGQNLVTLTGTDQSGNKGTCTATVTVQDLLVPVAKCKNATLNLGANGTVVVPPASINNNSTDNCAMSFTVVPATLTCANIGNNLVTLRVTDGANNLSTCTAIVTLKDATAPTALCKNATLFLNATGSATLSVAQVNNGSSDNCGISSLSLSKTLFNCADLSGPTWPVFLTLKDAANNTSTCTAYVTIKDNIAPTAICENTTVELGSNGKAVVYGADLAEGSYDNCAVWSYSPVAKVYTTANIGTNNLTITVRDWSNNAATCVSQVTVLPYGAGLENPVEDRDLDSFSPLRQDDLLVHLYPNPTFDRVNLAFELEADQAYQVTIWDVTGRLRLEQSAQGKAGENQILMDLRDLPAGMYVVIFESAGQQIQKKLVKDRDE